MCVRNAGFAFTQMQDRSVFIHFERFITELTSFEFMKMIS